MRLPDVSVIIPAYNAAATLPDCLQSLQQQTLPRERYEIIVVSDGSSDRTTAVAQSSGTDQVIAIAHSGPAAARNAGIAVARGGIILFTDTDCQPAADWIECMCEPFQDPQVDGVKGVYYTRQRSLVARFVQLEYEDKYDRMAGQERIDFVDTYSAAYRRRVFEQNQGFDPYFPRASGEDIELSYRLARQGHKLVFAPKAAVFHQHVDTIWKYLCRKYYVGFWRVRMYALHPGKMVADSHTPQTLKLQLLLVALLLGSLVLSILYPRTLLLSASIGAVFLLSTIPFVIKSLRRDAVVALLSPWFLLLRALVLGVGFAVGILWNLKPELGRKS